MDPAKFGSQQGLVVPQKKNQRISLDPNDLITYMPLHRTPRKSVFTAVATEPCNVNSSVMHEFCKMQRAYYNNYQFKPLRNLFMIFTRSTIFLSITSCEVRWLSHTNIPRRFNCVIKSSSLWRRRKNLSGNSKIESGCVISHLVDITKYLSELNIMLQNPNQLRTSLLSNVQIFWNWIEAMEKQLEQNNAVHFFTGRTKAFYFSICQWMCKIYRGI